MRGQRWHRVAGQGTVEYILVVAAILAAVIAAASLLIKPAVTSTMTSAKTVVENAATQFATGAQ